MLEGKRVNLRVMEKEDVHCLSSGITTWNFKVNFFPFCKSRRAKL